MPTLVDAKTEWSLKILIKRLDCEYDPRHLLGRLHTDDSECTPTTNQARATRASATTNLDSPWDVFTSRPVVTCTISPTHLHHSNFLLFHLLDH